MCLAIPARVVGMSAGEEARALVEVAGVRRYIHTGLLEDDPPKVGDWVLVHVGFAMSKVSEESALDQLRMLSSLGETDSAQEEFTGYGGAGATETRGTEP
jgi:hydrogenase expression/formation protein HypC